MAEIRLLARPRCAWNDIIMGLRLKGRQGVNWPKIGSNSILVWTIKYFLSAVLTIKESCNKLPHRSVMYFRSLQKERQVGRRKNRKRDKKQTG
jgi:hypothetical protein